MTGLKGDAYDATISLELISEPEDSWSGDSRLFQQWGIDMKSPSRAEEHRVPTAGIPHKVLAKVEGAHPREVISDSYPYSTKLSRREYDREKAKLQVELLKMQKVGH